MTPADAITILDRASGLAPMVRGDHGACMQAVETLRSALAAHDATALELQKLKAAITPPSDGPADPTAPSPCG